MKFLSRQNLFEFLKIAISAKVTTDYENRAKRQAESKVCAFLDMYHKAIPYRASSVHFATANFHPFRTLPVWLQTIKKLNDTVFMRQKLVQKSYQKPLLMILKNRKL